MGKGIAYIGIGSNLGNRRENIDRAIDLLKKSASVKVKRISSIYQTKPVGGPPQGDYLNGVIEIETELLPHALLKRLNDIEYILGRVRTQRWAPRTIDLDILLYEDIAVDDAVLTIPHPRMFEREFVLRGLREIAPHLKILKKASLNEVNPRNK